MERVWSSSHISNSKQQERCRLMGGGREREEVGMREKEKWNHDMLQDGCFWDWDWILSVFSMNFLPERAFQFILTWSFPWISYTGGLFFLHLLVLHSIFFPRCSTLHRETRSGGLRLSLRQEESKHPVYLSQREAGWRKNRHRRK